MPSMWKTLNFNSNNKIKTMAKFNAVHLNRIRKLLEKNVAVNNIYAKTRTAINLSLNKFDHKLISEWACLTNLSIFRTRLWRLSFVDLLIIHSQISIKKIKNG